ncbi:MULTISPECIES: hypothetical protein [unclassified Anaerobiospirillum]|uniref:hypothetical protein n=1 Tax=unclassified Anaerobiospirillum TaxID=2647410 RepID=UPI001FF219EA|nr:MULTISPECIES: hypothetical protein [unclassified Anaerobiospirillum]MCK0534618.1 hypothetical protein [Anaerobiospirillum sp. NML120511]MCK0540317.1 hypothetical protein [Anaerobiospirillum sp. NML02-A-032]
MRSIFRNFIPALSIYAGLTVLFSQYYFCVLSDTSLTVILGCSLIVIMLTNFELMGNYDRYRSRGRRLYFWYRHLITLSLVFSAVSTAVTGIEVLGNVFKGAGFNDNQHVYSVHVTAVLYTFIFIGLLVGCYFQRLVLTAAYLARDMDIRLFKVASPATVATVIMAAASAYGVFYVFSGEPYLIITSSPEYYLYKRAILNFGPVDSISVALLGATVSYIISRTLLSRRVMRFPFFSRYHFNQ